MANAWLEHVSEFRKKNQGMSYKSLLKAARKSYRGGEPVGASATKGVSANAASIGGGYVPYPQTNLASTAGNFPGGGKTRRKKSKLVKSMRKVKSMAMRPVKALRKSLRKSSKK
jgi:hypothetical protein